MNSFSCCLLVSLRAGAAAWNRTLRPAAAGRSSGSSRRAWWLVAGRDLLLFHTVLAFYTVPLFCLLIAIRQEARAGTCGMRRSGILVSQKLCGTTDPILGHFALSPGSFFNYCRLLLGGARHRSRAWRRFQKLWNRLFTPVHDHQCNLTLISGSRCFGCRHWLRNGGVFAPATTPAPRNAGAALFDRTPFDTQGGTFVDVRGLDAGILMFAGVQPLLNIGSCADGRFDLRPS